ncbi:MAG TPA: EAL domain-containing protein [Burkholderiales bacterium]|nr:EAL domain-containing protein [Burkholderiales bacterium]
MNSDTTAWTDPVAYLRQALAQDQFTLYCQPIAALSGVVVYPMAEVLVRLREEETAMLPPGDFLPVLEHYGMMPELDRWVVREVLRRLSHGPEIARFCINLSRQTIADNEFPDFFAHEIHASHVPADRVVFEIDEGDAAALPSSGRRLCAAVGSLGAGVLIDGFGRGQSQFARGQSQLASLGLPCVQFIKLDGSLTRNLATDEAAVARILALLRLTDDLGITAIAECVEDEEVLARLRAMKVRYAQGFGVCAPQSIDLVRELPAMRFSARASNESNNLVPVQGLLDLNTLQEARWPN